MKGVQYTPYEHNSLQKAVCEGRIEKVREIISSRSRHYSQEWSDASDGYTLLCTAVKEKHTAITKILLTNGSTVNSENEICSETPLHFAVRNGDVEIVQMLLHKGANIDAKDSFGSTPLHIAVVLQETEITRILLNEGASFEDINVHNVAPLHLAVANDSYAIVEMLLSKGANVNVEGEGGMTPLHLAARRGELYFVQRLIKYGANVNAVYMSRSEEGYTPLHLAARNDSKEIIKLLLRKGANVNAEAKDGLTALHIASMNGCKEIVVVLLEHGSDTTIMNKQNYTALDFAMYHDKPFHVVKILKHHMVKIKAANLYAVNKDRLSISIDATLNDFQNQCEKEIETMKREVINDNTTFYNILTRSVRLLARCVTNKSIIKTFRSNNYKIKFPIYASMIKRNFRKGEKEKEFMEKGDQIFGFLFSKNFPLLPRDCTEKILSYLNYEDLI